MTYEAELRQDTRGGWVVVVFPEDGTRRRIVYNAPGEGAAAVYRAEGVADFLGNRDGCAQAAWEESCQVWAGR